MSMPYKVHSNKLLSFIIRVQNPVITNPKFEQPFKLPFQRLRCDEAEIFSQPFKLSQQCEQLQRNQGNLNPQALQGVSLSYSSFRV